MKPKPAGLDPDYGDQFNDASIVAAYDTRPPYPEPLVSLILEITAPTGRRVLDLGCGTGELARRLAPHVAHVTAVDRSWRMIAAAKRLPGGDAPNIEWLTGAAEDVTLTGTFSLALAAESFHWFDWAVVCRRIPEVVPSSALVLVEGRFEAASPWADGLASLVARYSTNRDFEPYDVVDELTSRGCLMLNGRTRLGPHRFRQAVNDYITCIHSRNGFSRDRMSSAEVDRFDAAVRDLVTPYAREGLLDLEISTRVAWGRARACA